MRHAIGAVLVVMLALFGVLHKEPISASDGSFDGATAGPTHEGWVWSVEAGSQAGYSWSEGAGQLGTVGISAPVSAGYSWASGSAE